MSVAKQTVNIWQTMIDISMHVAKVYSVLYMHTHGASHMYTILYYVIAAIINTVVIKCMYNHVYKGMG